jgi:hypothetical protein
MFNPDDLTEYAYELSNRFESINSKYLELMGKHIKEIGTLTPTDIHRLEQMQRMGSNVAEIKKQLAKEAGITVGKLDKLYDAIINDSLGDTEIFQMYRNGQVTKLEDNLQLLSLVQSMKTQTENTFKNIAQTTAISEPYKELLDNGILAITEGVTDYKTVIRNI